MKNLKHLFISKVSLSNEPKLDPGDELDTRNTFISQHLQGVANETVGRAWPALSSLEEVIYCYTGKGTL